MILTKLHVCKGFSTCLIFLMLLNCIILSAENYLNRKMLIWQLQKIHFTYPHFKCIRKKCLLACETFSRIFFPICFVFTWPFLTDDNWHFQTSYSKGRVVDEVEAHLEDPGQVQDQSGHLGEGCNGTCHQEERSSFCFSVVFLCDHLVPGFSFLFSFKALCKLCAI